MNIHKDHQTLLDSYLEEKKALGASPQALRNAHSRIPHFLAYLEEEGLNADQTDIPAARGFMEYLTERGTGSREDYRVNTLASYRQAASSFSRWMRDSGKLVSDPFTAVKAPRGERIIPRDLPTEKELARLLSRLADFSAVKGLKARKRRYLTHVLAELLYASGLRISEAADLQEENLNLERKEITVIAGKGGFDRKVYLNDYAASVLRRFLSVRDEILTGKSNRERLFGSSSDELGKSFNRDLKEACGEVGIPFLTAHSLRHCLGYHLLKQGCPLRQIQQILGHRAIGNTEIYTKVDVTEVKEQLDRHHPRQLGKRR